MLSYPIKFCILNLGINQLVRLLLQIRLIRWLNIWSAWKIPLMVDILILQWFLESCLQGKLKLLRCIAIWKIIINSSLINLLLVLLILEGIKCS